MAWSDLKRCLGIAAAVMAATVEMVAGGGQSSTRAAPSAPSVITICLTPACMQQMYVNTGDSLAFLLVSYICGTFAPSPSPPPPPPPTHTHTHPSSPHDNMLDASLHALDAGLTQALSVHVICQFAAGAQQHHNIAATSCSGGIGTHASKRCQTLQ